MKLVAVVSNPRTPLDEWMLHRLWRKHPELLISEAPQDSFHGRGVPASIGASVSASFHGRVQRLLEDEALERFRHGVDLRSLVSRVDDAPDVAVVLPGVPLVDDLGARTPSRLTLAVRLGTPASPWDVWSAPLAIVRRRPEWIGARILVVDGGPSQEKLAWCDSPQIGPGDTGETLTVRATFLASEALAGILERVERGESMSFASTSPGVDSPSAPLPPLRDWLTYLLLARGARARLTYERALT